MTDWKPETIVVNAGRPEGAGAPLNAPLVTASNFQHGAGRVYVREDGTETWGALEQAVGALEGGPEGASALAYASGMAAAAAVFDQLTTGASVALPADVYHGVARLADEGEARGRWRVRRLETHDTAAWIEAAGRDDLLWIESPSNPLLELADLRAICAAPRKAGTLLAVDNTFATPLNQRPLLLGADLSVHSVTKFLGGHSDLVAGIVAMRGETLLTRLRATRQVQGALPGTLEAFLALRGLRTLALRLERAQANAQVLAEFLEQHPAVRAVRYPGLPSHPQHALAQAQLDGFGAVVTFQAGEDAASADALCESLRLIRHATSLGAVESTIERRGRYEGQAHLPPALLRLSVGIEAVEDLRDDLAQGLREIASRVIR
jgi:cystathionine gamma-synthase